MLGPQYADAHPFVGGLAAVKTTDGKMAYIDTSGEVVWSGPLPPEWECPPVDAR